MAGSVAVAVLSDPSIRSNAKALKIEKPKILKGFWCDEHFNEIKFLEYNQTPKLYLRLDFNTAAIDKRFKVKVFEDDFVGDDVIFDEGDWLDITSEEMYWELKEYSGEKFQKGGEGIQFLYTQVELEEVGKVYIPSNSDDYLKVHMVTFVPHIMKALGWANGEGIQKEWFSRNGSEEPEENEPEIDFFTMDWVLGFQRAKTIYDNMISNKIWVNAAGQRELINQIKEMGVTLPTSVGQVESFGSFAKTIETVGTRQIPFFDRHHHQERAFNEDLMNTTDENLDDLYATLANFVFRLCGKGTITLKEGDLYEIKVSEIAIYVRDSFNFIDEGWNNLYSQPLGYWDPKNNQASTEKQDGYYYIKNESYNDYREDTDKGGDFIVFSDLKITQTNDSFEVSVASF